MASNSQSDNKYNGSAEYQIAARVISEGINSDALILARAYMAMVESARFDNPRLVKEPDGWYLIEPGFKTLICSTGSTLYEAITDLSVQSERAEKRSDNKKDVENLIASVRYNLTGPQRAMIEVDRDALEQAFADLLAAAARKND